MPAAQSQSCPWQPMICFASDDILPSTLMHLLPTLRAAQNAGKGRQKKPFDEVVPETDSCTSALQVPKLCLLLCQPALQPSYVSW